MPSRVLADFEEGRFQTFVGQRLEHCRGTGPRTVVEGQNDFLVVEEIVLLEMLEAESGAAGGVDLDNPREAHATGALALWDGAGGRRGYVLNGSVRHRAIRAGIKKMRWQAINALFSVKRIATNCQDRRAWPGAANQPGGVATVFGAGSAS